MVSFAATDLPINEPIYSVAHEDARPGRRGENNKRVPSFCKERVELLAWFSGCRQQEGQSQVETRKKEKGQGERGTW